jgi:predicted transcriptional regulator
MENITRKESFWIKYQMSLKGITQFAIARYAGCSQPMVSQVLHGRKRSANVQSALIRVLGYDSFKKLIEDANCGGIA